MSRFTGKPGVFAMEEEARRRRSGADPGANVHANMLRAKVYCLIDGKWEDQGTGHVTIDYIEEPRDIALAVVDEIDNVKLLLHKITSDDIYKKQETIISWKDPEKALELALNFQEAEGCAYIWKNMLSVQENLKSGSLGTIPCPRFETTEGAPEASSGSDKFFSSDQSEDLPPRQLSGLPLLLKTVLERGAKDQLRVAKLISQDHEFFPKLVEFFKMCESSRKMDDLHMIFRLVKGIILLNNFEIFHKIFSDEFILDIIGALEYDPEVPNAQSHRTVVQKHAIFEEAVPIGNASVASKIHQTYRIGYIRDVILQRALDDATKENLNSIIHENNVLVACFLKDDASFIQDLFIRMRSSNISAESKSKQALFLRDFCILSKSLQSNQHSQLYRDLFNKGVVDIISDMLSQDKVLVSAGTDILKHFLDQEPCLVSEFIAHMLHHEEEKSLLGILVQGIVIDSGEGTLYQSFLRTLLGSSTPKVTTKSEEVKEVIQVFVDRHLHKLIDVIPSCCTPKVIARSTSGSVGVDTMAEQRSPKPETLLFICQLSSFCVRHHPNRIKFNVFARNAMEKILTLIHWREDVLVVAAVQFMQYIIGRKDELLINHVIKLNLLKPIIEVFVENGDRDNMVRSVVLELLEDIRKENLGSLIKYVVGSFWDQLTMFELLGSIQAFGRTHQEIVEGAKTKQSANVVDIRKKADERGADKEEEGYFIKDSDKEDSATPAKRAQKQSIPVRHKSDGLATSTESSHGSGDSQNQQYTPETLDPEHQKDEDCNAYVGDLPPKMVLDTTKSTDSEPN